MIEFYFKEAADTYFAPVSEPQDGCWIHVDEAAASDLDAICQLSGLAYTDLQDSLDRYEIPRVEKIDSTVLIFCRHPIHVDTAVGLYTATLTMVLAKDYFITISPQKNTLIRSFLSKDTHLSTRQHSKLAINLLMRITHEFSSQTRHIRHSVLDKEKEMIKVESDDITILTRHEEILNQYLSTLEPMRKVLETIPSVKYTMLFEKEHELIDDLRHAVSQSETLCTIAVKTIRSLRDSYQIIFTNNLHKTIKLLTSLTIIISIPTMVASIYGMNITLPLAHETHAFLAILSIIFSLSIVALWFFRRKRWL